MLTLCGLKNLVAGNHDTKIDHFEVIALQNNTDNVLANIVYVAFDCRHHDFAVGTQLAVFGFFDERDQVADRLFHNARRLDDLRQKHFAVAEQIADDIHAVH